MPKKLFTFNASLMGILNDLIKKMETIDTPLILNKLIIIDVEEK